MATESRDPDPPLESVLFEEAYRFDFFQAVRVLERLYPERRPVGRDARPAEEVVRFRARLSLAFPPSEIHELTPAEDGRVGPEMTVAFMGLTGPLGVLPRHYTELLIERGRQRDFVLRDFLDLFNHRLISLFYRAWEKYHFVVDYERTVRQGEWPDRVSRYLFDLVGMGTEGLHGRVAFDDQALLFYTGLLSQRPRSATALAGLLGDYFGVTAEIVQLVGQWLPLAEENQTQLGTANGSLGRDTVAGSRVWSQQARFRLRVGPLTLARFDHFLPPNSAFNPLVALTRFFVGDELAFDLQLVLKASEVPGCRLGATGPGAPRLGWSTWLKGVEFRRDADDVVLSGVPWTAPAGS